MRYLCIYRAPEDAAPPSPELFAAMDALTREMTERGVLVATGGLKPSLAGKRMRAEQGRITVTDGPFAEAKEVVGGFAIIEVPSEDEAMAWTERFMRVHIDNCGPDYVGSSEVRVMYDEADFAPQAADAGHGYSEHR